MASSPYSFTKGERLCSRSLVEQLFQDGQRLMVFPYSVRLLLVPDGTLPGPAQVLVVAPKRHLRHAVDRNRAKRLTRECYRLRKQRLYDTAAARGVQVLLALSYVHKVPMPYAVLAKKMDKLLDSVCHLVTTS